MKLSFRKAFIAGAFLSFTPFIAVKASEIADENVKVDIVEKHLRRNEHNAISHTDSEVKNSTTVEDKESALTDIQNMERAMIQKLQEISAATTEDMMSPETAAETIHKMIDSIEDTLESFEAHYEPIEDYPQFQQLLKTAKTESIKAIKVMGLTADHVEKIQKLKALKTAQTSTVDDGAAAVMELGSNRVPKKKVVNRRIKTESFTDDLETNHPFMYSSNTKAKHDSRVTSERIFGSLRNGDIGGARKILHSHGRSNRGSWNTGGFGLDGSHGRKLATKNEQCALLAECVSSMSMLEMLILFLSDDIDPATGEIDKNLSSFDGMEHVISEYHFISKLASNLKSTQTDENCDKLLSYFHRTIEHGKVPQWQGATISQVCLAEGSMQHVLLSNLAAYLGESSITMDGDRLMKVGLDHECTPNKPCGECHGGCNYDGDCDSGFVCYRRGGTGAPSDRKIPGCVYDFDKLMAKAHQNYCVRSIPPVKFDTKRSNLQRCQGDCDYDTDCEGHLKCFHRAASHFDWTKALPGCELDLELQKTSKLADFCYDPTDATDLPRLVYRDGSFCSNGSCTKCQGDCDNDADCEGNLKCFHRDPTNWDDQVPGCHFDKEFQENNHYPDFCYNPEEPTKLAPPLVDGGGSKCSPERPCNMCHGDCDSDDDCYGSLKCLHRNINDGTMLTPVPGCEPDVSTQLSVKSEADYCYDPSLKPNLYNGGSNFCNPSNPCPKCLGDCNKDADCLGHLKCFQRQRIRTDVIHDLHTAIPGCNYDMFNFEDSETDFCYDPNDFSDNSLVTAGEYSLCTEEKPCDKCMGHCRDDDDCAEGLRCFQRLSEKENAQYSPIPGCISTDEYLEERNMPFYITLFRGSEIEYRLPYARIQTKYNYCYNPRDAADICANSKVRQDMITVLKELSVQPFLCAAELYFHEDSQNSLPEDFVFTGTKQYSLDQLKMGHALENLFHFPFQLSNGGGRNEHGQITDISQPMYDFLTYSDLMNNLDECVLSNAHSVLEDCEDENLMTCVAQECEKGFIECFSDEVYGAMDRALALVFGDQTATGFICGIKEAVITHGKPFPGTCCLDAPYQLSGSNWGQPYDCATTCQTPGPYLAGINEGACLMYGGRWCPAAVDCSELKVCVDEMIMATANDDDQKAFRKYLEDSPTADISDTTDFALCGLAREYFGFDANYVNDKGICEEVEELRYTRDFAFLNEFFGQGSGGENGENEDGGEGCSTSAPEEVEPLILEVPDRTESSLIAVVEAPKFTTYLSTMEMYLGTIKSVFEFLDSIECPEDFSGGVKTACAIAKNIVSTIMAAIIAPMEVVLEIANLFFELEALETSEQTIQAWENTAVLEKNLQSIADWLTKNASRRQLEEMLTEHRLLLAGNEKNDETNQLLQQNIDSAKENGADLQTVKDDVIIMGNSMAKMDGKVASMNENMENVDDKVARMNENMAKMDGKVASMKENMENMDGVMTGIQSEITTLKDEMAAMKDEILKTLVEMKN